MTDIYTAEPEAAKKKSNLPYQVQKEAKKKIEQIKEGEIRGDDEAITFRQSYLLLFFRLGIAFVLMGFFYIVLLLLSRLLAMFGVYISPNTSPLIALISFLAFLLIGFVLYIKWKNTYYTLREKSLDLTTGLIETVTRTLRLDTFAGITIEQSMLGKLLNYGTIVLEYQAKEQTTEPLTFFPDPEQYGELIKERIKNV